MEGRSTEAQRLAVDTRDAIVRLFSTLHEAAYAVTAGRVLNRVLGMKVVQLTVTGRNSGVPRRTMLTAPIVEDDRVVLVASNGGDSRDPQWYRNLLVCPDVSVMWDGTVHSMRARVAAASERPALWRRIRAATPTYDFYQSRTTRQLPIVVLEPIDAS
jgi:deazaflavin-dependent oxidoreductase (nitroreductase family)